MNLLNVAEVVEALHQAEVAAKNMAVNEAADSYAHPGSIENYVEAWIVAKAKLSYIRSTEIALQYPEQDKLKESVQRDYDYALNKLLGLHTGSVSHNGDGWQVSHFREAAAAAMMVHLLGGLLDRM